APRIRCAAMHRALPFVFALAASASAFFACGSDESITPAPSSSSSSSSGTGGAGGGAGGGGGMGGCPSQPKPPSDAVPLLGAACDPLVPTQCGYPFPSNVWLVDDPSTVTKKRLAIPKEAMPKKKDGSSLDPA